MKPGDMVQLRPGSSPNLHEFWLYGGEEHPWDVSGRLIPTDIPYNEGELGLIIGCARDKLDQRIFYKLITPRGVGWVRSIWLRTVE